MSVNVTDFDKYTKVWSGQKPQEFFNVDCSIGRILFALMRNNPSKVCQIAIGDDTIMTNREALTFAIRIAQQLRGMGLKQGDIVGIIAGNISYVVPVILACLFNCTPFHSVNFQNDEETIKQQFSITRPKIIFCDGHIYQHLTSTARTLKSKIYTLKHHRANLPKIEDMLEPTKSELDYIPESLMLGGDQTIAIVCTAGTSGPPKAVCISNNAVLPNFNCNTNGLDIVLTFCTADLLPGLLHIINSLAHNCTRIVTDKPFTPDYLLELVHNFHVTILTLGSNELRAVTNCENLSEEKLRSISTLNIVGGSCTLLCLMKFREHLQTCRINYGYGLTECGQVATNVGLDRHNTVGKLLPGIKVKIVDDTGRCLSHGGIGEILVHNGKIWNGYYGNPSETKRMQDYQNWFHTEDLGYFDSENFLHVVERKRDVLKFHGMQYWPQEIEHVITELPAVLEACVFGLWNEVDGDAAAAAVVKVQNSKLTEQDVVEYVAKRLVVTQKQLHCGVFFLPALPKTTSGKVLRDEARDLALGKKWQPTTKRT